MHTQCLMKRNNSSTVRWIPKAFAQVGRLIDLKEAGTWDRGWTVAATYTDLPSETVMERSQDYKRTRRASDI